MTSNQARTLVENLCKKITDGEKAAICKEVMQPIFDRIKQDCYLDFLASCKNNYQNIDNSGDDVIRLLVTVVELFETSINNTIRTGKDADDQKGREANHGRN